MSRLPSPTRSPALPSPVSRLRRRSLLAAAALLAGATAAANASAQQPGSIEGSVTAQEDGRPLAGVRVSVVGSARAAATSADGRFHLAALAAGRYTLQATQLGRAPQQVTVSVAAGDAARARFVLAEGSVLLPGVVTTTTRAPQAATHTTADVAVLTREQVRTSPARTTDDLLREMPGVELPRVSGGVAGAEQILSIRGTDEGRSLVLVDGVPLNDPWGEWIDWARVPRSLVDHVEVVEGGGSSLYGTYAMGGVVQLFTRPIAARQLAARAGAGTRDARDLSLSGSDLFGRLGVAVSGDLVQGGGYTLLRPAQRGTIDGPTRSSSRNAGARAEYALAADRTVYATATLLDEERDLGTPLTGSDRRIGAISAGAELGRIETGRVSAGVFASSQGYHSRQARPGSGRSSETRAADQSIPSHDAGASLQWARGSAEGAVLSAGADVRYMVGRMDEQVYGTTGVVAGTRSAGGDQVVGGVFAQAALVPLPPVRLEASVRLDGWRNWNGTRHDATVTPARDTSYAERADVALSPRVGLRWAARRGLAFRASAYKAFRAPTLSEQYRTFFSGPLTFQGNPALGVERLSGMDAGFDWQLHPRVELRGTAFWNEMRDLAGFVDVGNNTRRRLNQGHARSRGAEGELALRPVDAITIVGSYDYDDARVTHVAKETRIARVPMQRAAARVSWAPGARGALSAIWRYEGSNIALGGAPLPHFGVLDLDARWSPLADAELYASVQNVGDRAYVANRSGALEYLGLPRTVVVGIALR